MHLSVPQVPRYAEWSSSQQNRLHPTHPSHLNAITGKHNIQLLPKPQRCIKYSPISNQPFPHLFIITMNCSTLILCFPSLIPRHFSVLLKWGVYREKKIKITFKKHSLVMGNENGKERQVCRMSLLYLLQSTWSRRWDALSDRASLCHCPSARRYGNTSVLVFPPNL